jgi:threonine dehydrogenase-like Zn-dependent dehydrogenase
VTDLMWAAVLEAPGRMVVGEVPKPRPGPGQVRVRLEGCGVCASNLPPWEGRAWFTYPMEPGALGHEGWGRIDALGPGVTGLAVGDRVAAMAFHSYAEFDIADAGNVIALPSALDGKPFPGEPLGCALNIFARSRVEPGQTVAVVGIGFLGALLTRLAADAGATVIALARRPFARQIGLDMGAAHALPMPDGERWRAVEQVSALTDGKLCDVVIEAVGKQEPLDLAGELVRERGCLVIAGYHQDGLRSVNLQQWNWRGIDVVNAHERDPLMYTGGIARAVDAVASGQLDPFPLYTHTFPLERLGDALDATRDRPDGFLKALVRL